MHQGCNELLSPANIPSSFRNDTFHNDATVVIFVVTFRYNLLREENEGYSKLLSLLLSGGSLQQQHVAALTRDIKALIGEHLLLCCWRVYLIIFMFG